MHTMERTARSWKYQSSIRESTYSEDEWRTIALLNPVEQSVAEWLKEELTEYDLQLEQMFWKHIDTHLTDKQKEICVLLKMAILQNEILSEKVPELSTEQEGAQQWIANKLNVLQCTINIAIKGRFFYQGGVARRWGGIATKLAKIIAQDTDMQNIIQTMTDLGADDCSARLPHWRCFKKLTY